MSETSTPSRNEVRELPLLAQVAFSARCAERVLPLFDSGWPAAPDTYKLAVRLAMETAWRMAGKDQQRRFPRKGAAGHQTAFAAFCAARAAESASAAATAAASITPSAQAAACAAEAVSLAAEAGGNAITSTADPFYPPATLSVVAVAAHADTRGAHTTVGDPPTTPTFNSPRGIPAAEAAIRAVTAAESVGLLSRDRDHTLAVRMQRAMRSDFDILVKWSSKWIFGRSSLRREYFGPLWPDGPPNGWPATEQPRVSTGSQAISEAFFSFGPEVDAERVLGFLIHLTREVEERGWSVSFTPREAGE